MKLAGSIRTARGHVDAADQAARFRDLGRALGDAIDGVAFAVAAVNLLVGSIGFMNIMLVFGDETAREVGIRLVIGALERQIFT